MEALEAARARTTVWVQRALASDIAELPIRTSFEREEAIEAYRALRAGGATLVALYLRHGNPRGALDAIDKGDLARIVPPGLRERLERASADDDPEAWADLFRLFDAAEQADRPETALNAGLARAATFGIALELYRSEPNSARGATPLSVLLAEHGMAEVAPLVLGAALKANASAQDVSWALGLVLRAMVDEEQMGQLDAARRTFENAAPLLQLADAQRSVGKVRPSAARLRYVMGALEMRAGQLEKARPLLEAASRVEPTLEVLMSLAAVDRPRDATSALRSLTSAIEVAKKNADSASEAEAWIAIFEIQRDRAEAEQARQALGRALERALEARRQARNGPTHARAERLLARVLEHYRDEQGARRATQRAYEASESDLRQLTATVLDAARRALTRGDLAAARDAVRRAIEAKLSDEDIVYAALWLKLLERRLAAPSDGTAEEAFATIDDTSGWPAKLRAWATRRLSDAGLLQAARDGIQRTEAVFYAAMATHSAGKSDAALLKLREVAQSGAIELVEVTIARDLLAQQSAKLDVQLPTNVDVP
jgi:tetratricopeptide (TPR) repeat protein